MEALNLSKYILTTSVLIGLLAIQLGCSSHSDEIRNKELRITGTIDIDQKLIKLTSESDTIFLIARPATGGRPLAVERFVGNNYPYRFSLTEKNMMMPQENITTPLNLSVRVDKDGNAMTRAPGDLVGVFEKNPVSLQSDNIHLQIRTKI